MSAAYANLIASGIVLFIQASGSHIDPGDGIVRAPEMNKHCAWPNTHQWIDCVEGIWAQFESKASIALT